jgi:MSHA biogenesis protein MshL
MKRILFFCVIGATLLGCSTVIPPDPAPSPAHLEAPPPAAPAEEIPSLVTETPILPPPEPLPETEKYTVVVNEVPVKELLFALARDAKVNVDIHPSISGLVTLNAVEQTLPQILNRIAKQVDMRYEIAGSDVVVLPDEPYLRTYKVDYVNMSRETESTAAVATQIATTGYTNVEGAGGGGGAGGAGQNNSITTVVSKSDQKFWITLTQNVMLMLGEEDRADAGGEDLPISENVIANPESGILTVRATAKQHEKIQEFIDSVLENAQRQVLIEATIVEVELSDQYSAGVDWARIATSAGLSIAQALAPATTLARPIFALEYDDREAGGGAVNVTVTLLQEYGDVSVLSSPRLMVLNNQTALLKVVDNVVYFTVEQETNTTQGVVTNTFESTVHTVPVGFVMMVTPQINSNSRVTINIRPTISRIQSFVSDPNPALTVQNLVPQIQVREMESLLHVNSGQVAILGGLMQDSVQRDSDGVPGLESIEGVGELFKNRTDSIVKSELVIFLRPVVVANADINGDLREYRQYLEHTPGFDRGSGPNRKTRP